MAELDRLEDLMSSQVSVLENILSAVEISSARVNTDQLSSTVNQLNEMFRKETLARKQFTDRLGKAGTGGGPAAAATGQGFIDNANKFVNGTNSILDSIKNVFSPFVNGVGILGFEVAGTIGLTRRAGVQLITDLRQAQEIIAGFSPDAFASFEQTLDVVASAGQQFTGLREGLQFSGDGLYSFATQLNQGFKAPFNLTKQSLDALIVTGMSTATQFEQFRKSTGRAALSSEQFTNIVGRNNLAFLIYGDKIARGIVDLDRVGVNVGATIATQEGIVGNLEGTLDAVNQLNMLGAQINFEQLIRLSELGTPVETFQFLLRTIPADLLKSTTSFRLLAKAIPGLDPEALLRAQAGNVAAADSIERSLTEPQRAISAFSNGVAEAAQKAVTLPETFAGLTLQTGAAGVEVAGKVGQTALTLGKDVISGYGDRTLVTPRGNIALKNNDTVIAGTQLFSEGSIRMSTDNTALHRKLDNLISAIMSANTTVNVDGSTKTMPRISLAGVYVRNERV